MASNSIPSETSSPQPSPAHAELKVPRISRFEQISGRLRGTVLIHGDVVNADPELWTCERG